MLLLHRPDGNDDFSAYPQDSGKLANRPDSTLGCGKMMNYRDR